MSSNNPGHTAPQSLASSSGRASPGASKRSRLDRSVSPQLAGDDQFGHSTGQQDQWSDIEGYASQTPDGPNRPHTSGRDNLTTKRREANRLAAQRFRSRKKGYQESLEEKVRELQEENAMLVRRLESQAGPLPLLPAHLHAQPGDIRFTALDSANRQLRDENRSLEAELRRLSSEVEMWRSWAQRHREGYPWPEAEQVRSSSYYRTDRDLTSPHLPCHSFPIAPPTFPT